MLQNYFTFLLMDNNNSLENSHALTYGVFAISYIQLQQPGGYQANPIAKLNLTIYSSSTIVQQTSRT